MNQAFFKRVWVTEDGVVGYEFSEPVASLMKAHGIMPVLAEGSTNPGDTWHGVVYQRRKAKVLVGAFSGVGFERELLADLMGWLANPTPVMEKLFELLEGKDELPLATPRHRTASNASRYHK
jgi:hypothetical protein